MSENKRTLQSEKIVCSNPMAGSGRANAEVSLIEAAPQLLEALKKAVKQLENLGSDGLASGANAAISKATPALQESQS